MRKPKILRPNILSEREIGNLNGLYFYAAGDQLEALRDRIGFKAGIDRTFADTDIIMYEFDEAITWLSTLRKGDI